MTQRLFVLFVAMLFAVHGWSQGENNIWTFGDQDGLNFNAGGPVYYRDSMYSYEGCASVCDATGHLLFYSDGQYVYNRNHVAMPNSGGLVGHKRSSTQGVGIVRIPGYDSLYYLFILEAWEQTTGKLRYSQIDMTLDGGLGDIVSGKKDVVLDSAMSEKMAFAGVCGHPWLITHHKDSAQFYAYKINSASTIGAPVVSYCGLYNDPWSYGYGEMKVSRNANRLALANPTRLELYDFDESSGLVSNYMPIDTVFFSVKYGVEFSPDMSKLYTTEGLMQYDLSLPTPKDIMDSKLNVAPPALSVFSALRTGPDDKIYFVGPLGSVFSRIEFPNLADTFCRVQRAFIPDRPSPKKAYIGIGLNAFMPKNKLGDTVIQVSEKKLCTGDTLWIKGYGYKHYNWSDGDTASAKKFYKPGKVWLISRINCIVNIDTYIINVLPAAISAQLVMDTLVCSGKSIPLASEAGRNGYHWQDGDTARTRYFKPPVSICCSSYKQCTLFIDTFVIREEKPVYTFYSKDMLICPLDRITLRGQALSDSYTWFDGSDKDSVNVTGGTYWVQSQTACKIRVDTFHVIEQPNETKFTSTLVKMCDGIPGTLTDYSSADRRIWSTGDTARSINITLAGRYWVRTVKDCNVFVDTFNAVSTPSVAVYRRTDTVACLLSSLQLSASDSFQHFQWNAGGTQRDTTVYQTARVFVLATDTIRCRALKHDFNVTFVTYESRLRDTFTCNEDTVLLDASIPDTAAAYEWSTGERSAILKMNQAGTRYISIRSRGCTIRDTVEIKKIELPLSIGGDQVVCRGEKIMLKADVNGVSYKWSTGASGPEIEVSESGRYRLTVVKGACTASDEADIRFVQCTDCVDLPSAFTPNRDGINDRFKPLFNCPVLEYEFSIRNRWGNLLFTTTSPNDSWDGTANGNALDGNVYYYMIRVKFDNRDDKVQLFKGDVTLIR